MHDRTLLHDDLLHAAERSPDETALVCRDIRHSYAEVLSAARAVAAALAAQGVQRADRVALFLDNGFAFVAGVYGTLLAGAVAVPVNPETKTDKLAYLLGDAGPAALLTQASLARTWRHAVVLAGTKTVFALPAPDGAEAEGALPWPRDEGEPLVLPGTLDTDPAAILYTAGSTGFPTAVMRSNRDMAAAVRSIADTLGLRDDDRIVCAPPLPFDDRLHQMLTSVRAGATVIVERACASAAETLETMAHERATVFTGVPTLFERMLASRAAHDLPALRLIAGTGAALPAPQVAWLRTRFPQAALVSMDGSADVKRFARRDDIIGTGGERVAPKEVENAIHALDGVHEVAVVGVPDALLGQAVKARITRLPGASLTEHAVIEHCREHLESFAVPTQVEFVVELPGAGHRKLRRHDAVAA